MAENSRIDDLRRRVQKDPASIAFAQLAEECRRAGRVSGGRRHLPGGPRDSSGLSVGARDARARARRARSDRRGAGRAGRGCSTSAPENLAAIRGLAEIHHRRGELAQALAAIQGRAAARPQRSRSRGDDRRPVASGRAARSRPASGGLTLEHMQHELLKHTPPTPPKPPPAVPAAPAAQFTPPPRWWTIRLKPDSTKARQAGSPEEPAAEAGAPEQALRDPLLCALRERCG